MRNLIYWAIGFIILVIILFFVLRKPKMKPMSEPSMIWGESYYEISPIEDTNVENYQIEYSDPSTPKYSDSVLTSLVKVTVFWKNKYGFEDVTKIRITRTLGNNSSNVEVEKTSTVTNGTHSDKKSWFENFNRTFNTYTFEETNDTTKNFMGNNTFKIEYITSGSTTYKTVTGINQLELPLNRNDIQLKLNTNDFTNVVFTPNIKPDSKPDSEYVIEGYFLYPDFSTSFVYPLPYAFGETANNKFNFTVDQNDNKKVNVNYGGEYIKIDTGTKLKLDTGKTNAIQFDLLKPNSKQNILILGILNTSKTNFDKVFTLKKSAAAREAHLVNFNSINDEDEYKSMFLSFSTTSLGDGNQDCLFQSSLEPCITDKNGHSANFLNRVINVDRGEQVHRITIEQEQTGNGVCVHRGKDIRKENASEGVYKTNNKVLMLTKCPVNCQKRIEGFGGRCRKEFGDCINTSESGTLPAIGVWTDDEPAVNGGTCPSVTGTVSCRTGDNNTFNSLSPPYAGMLGQCDKNCPAATATPTSPTCIYNAGGRTDQPARQNVTWVSRNEKNCNHVSTPTSTTIRVASCGGDCHVPNWKAVWYGCNDDYGEAFDIEDENRWNRKTGQPICNGYPDYTGWSAYNQDTDNQGTGMCGHGDDGFFEKASKDDNDIEAAQKMRFDFTFNNPVNGGTFTNRTGLTRV